MAELGAIIIEDDSIIGLPGTGTQIPPARDPRPNSLRVYDATNEKFIEVRSRLISGANLILYTPPSLPTGKRMVTVDQTGAIEFEPIGSGGGGGGGIASKEKLFTDADLTIAGRLIWQHNMGSVPSTIRVIELAVGEDWNVPWNDLSPDTLSIDFSHIRPLPGNWRVVALPS